MIFRLVSWQWLHNLRLHLETMPTHNFTCQQHMCEKHMIFAHVISCGFSVMVALPRHQWRRQVNVIYTGWDWMLKWRNSRGWNLRKCWRNKQDTITCWCCCIVPARRCAWPWRRSWFEADDEESRWQRHTCSCFYQLRQPWSIRRSLTLDAAHTLVPCLCTLSSRLLQCHPRWCARRCHPEVAVCSACCCTSGWCLLERAYHANCTRHAPRVTMVTYRAADHVQDTCAQIHSARSSLTVTHPSTNRGRRCLTWVNVPLSYIALVATVSINDCVQMRSHTSLTYVSLTYAYQLRLLLDVPTCGLLVMVILSSWRQKQRQSYVVVVVSSLLLLLFGIWFIECFTAYQHRKAISNKKRC